MFKNNQKFSLPIFISLFVALSTFFYSDASPAATLMVVNQDGAGEGFYDPAPVNPVGGNTGTTLGQQRLIVFQRAASIWGSYLQSSVPIKIGAQFDPLPCQANSGTLGSAGPTTIARDFPGAPLPSTMYPIALANALSGVDLVPGSNHINATFSSNIGTPGCLQGSGWYFGLDGAPPTGKIDFLSVLLHELGHGLGFLSLVNSTDGSKILGYDDPYMKNLERHGANPPDFPSMSDAQRVMASTDTGNLHWTGANVRAAGSLLTIGRVGDHVRMFAPNPVERGSSVSHWDNALAPNQMMEAYYSGVIHSPELELPLFKDIGWSLLTAIQYYPLSVTATGAGTISSNPAGINCGVNCSANYAVGTVVTLTPTASGNNSFSGWSGACTGSASSCTVTMNAANSVGATFSQAGAPVLSIAKVGSGSGNISRSGGALNCGSTCSETLSPGAVVTLIATPEPGNLFDGWSGGTCNGAGNCVFNINTDITATATFNSNNGSTTVTPLIRNNVSGAAGSEQYFNVDVPAYAKNLLIQTSGGSGDADLYVRFGSAPTVNLYDCRPYNFGNTERCTFDIPTPGTYYIMIRGATDFSKITLNVSYEETGAAGSTEMTTILNFLLLN